MQIDNRLTGFYRNDPSAVKREVEVRLPGHAQTRKSISADELISTLSCRSGFKGKWGQKSSSKRDHSPSRSPSPPRKRGRDDK